MMDHATNFLSAIRRIMKLHEGILKGICEEYKLTLMEGTIISFLYHNPERDTAADIVEYRMLSKGNVSQAVESLIQKSLLQRRRDTGDRRRIHLSLTSSSLPVTKSIEKSWKKFRAQIFSGISEDEMEMFERINSRIMENAQKAGAEKL